MCDGEDGKLELVDGLNVRNVDNFAGVDVVEVVEDENDVVEDD